MKFAQPSRLTVPLTLLAICCLLPANVTNAEIKLPQVFGEHMVLQRDREIKIWGTADPKQTLSISLADQKTTATADDQGRWQATLPAMKAGGPYRMTVGSQGAEPAIEFNDILIGEVWLCSGQSNMQWTVRQAANPDQEIAAANHPKIRHLGVQREQSASPKDDFNATWEVCSPDTVANFSAVAYYFGRALNEDLDVPIGVINSSWGGTRVEPWTPPVGFAEVPALAEIAKDLRLQDPQSAEHRELLLQHINEVEAWLPQARQALQQNQTPPPTPGFPQKLKTPDSHQSPTKLYNAMIHPLVGLPMRGAIWYQGESNHTEGMLYFEKKKALINGWREIWKQGDFPFYFVQIAPYRYGNEASDVLPTFWEAQEKVTEIPNTGMVVISDIGNLDDIHPKNKQEVGKRLAMFALKNDYGRDVVAGGPRFESLETQDGKLVVTFSNVGEGLKTRDGKPPAFFEIAGKDSEFQQATATIDGNRVILESNQVSNPTAVRFAWDKLAEPNLVNSTGVPPTAFRSGEVQK